MTWTFSTPVPPFYLFVRGTSGKLEMPFAVIGLGFLPGRSVSGWMKEGKWEMIVWADFRSDRGIRLQIQGGGASPGILQSRDAFARGICKRVFADDRFSGEPIFRGCLVVPGRWLFGWFLGPILWTFLAGAVRMRICSLPRTRPFRGSLRNNGNCA